MYRFTIKDIEHLSGIKAHTIRIWEKRYGFLMPARSSTNIRYYTVAELRTLLDTAFLNKYGYKISAVLKMSHDDIQHAIINTRQPGAVPGNLCNRLVLCVVEMDLSGFGQLLNTFIRVNGIDACITDILAPLLGKIAFLHSHGRFDGEVLSAFPNIIRQKIISGIEQQNIIPGDSGTVLLFLPEDEHYEIELLYMQYLVRREGLQAIYLGANVPVKDVVKIASYKKPGYIYTMLCSQLPNFKTEKYLEKLSSLFHAFKIVIMAKQLQRYEKHIPENIKLVSSVAETMMSFS